MVYQFNKSIQSANILKLKRALSEAIIRHSPKHHSPIFSGAEMATLGINST